MRSGYRLIVVLAAVLTSGCFDQPLRVDTIQVGRSLNVDQSIATLSTSFKPNDTVYVSILTTARGSGAIRARWFYGTQQLSEREKRVKFQGAGATAFNISPTRRPMATWAR